ncbi:hypothetical protein [Streptosporangium lutulentum]|uniref:Uncharacterized protein n=1 Tax=Streptosporangium lutulentum TaxID=1461250 RepID=A0ABT9QRF7_9ACTN|nr:hypothetical protein [Streptosporangium lutulentum]MDP9849340.1 hypothetical protein [Streptosporangium lutulentum]
MLPTKGLALLGLTGAGSMVALKVYAGVTAPEIPPDKLREIAKVFYRLADDIDGGTGKNAPNGIADRGDDLASAVWNNPKNEGPAVDAFQRLYQGILSGYAPQLAKDCRVVAIGCEAYAEQIEEVNKSLAQCEDLILQIVWLVAFQPMTTALYGVAVARIAALVKVAKGLKSAFALNAAKIMEMTIPKYAMTTLLYMVMDGAAYATGSMALTKTTQLAHGQPIGSLKENAAEFGKIVGANGAYVLGYDAAKLPLRGAPTTRGIELGARLVGSAGAYTPTYSLLDDDGQVMTTDEEWASKITGHGLRAAIFPPGWKFR